MDDSCHHGQHALFDNQIAREWFSTSEAAQYLGVSPNALRIMVHRGHIASYKLRSRLRFRFRDLRSVLQRKGSDLWP
jgi:excisionase family DNA binding protein